MGPCRPWVGLGWGWIGVGQGRLWGGRVGRGGTGGALGGWMERVWGDGRAIGGWMQLGWIDGRGGMGVGKVEVGGVGEMRNLVALLQ